MSALAVVSPIATLRALASGGDSHTSVARARDAADAPDDPSAWLAATRTSPKTHCIGGARASVQLAQPPE